jgi:hypothetical protein
LEEEQGGDIQEGQQAMPVFKWTLSGTTRGEPKPGFAKYARIGLSNNPE